MDAGELDMGFLLLWDIYGYNIWRPELYEEPGKVGAFIHSQFANSSRLDPQNPPLKKSIF